MSALLCHELPEPEWFGEPAKMLTPFELDNLRKSDALMRFRDQRVMRSTCANCGGRKSHHGVEVALGRCTGWRRMDLKAWAEECGVDIQMPEAPKPQGSAKTQRRPLFAPREI